MSFEDIPVGVCNDPCIDGCSRKSTWGVASGEANVALADKSPGDACIVL
mgnify:CR=1 FL=1